VALRPRAPRSAAAIAAGLRAVSELPRGSRAARSRPRSIGCDSLGGLRHRPLGARRILGDEGSRATQQFRRLPRACRGGQAIPKRAKTTELDKPKGARRAKPKRAAPAPKASAKSGTSTKRKPKQRQARRGANGAKVP